MSQTKAQLIEGLNINTSAPADALVIDSSGNVGIGTTSPSKKLEISASSAEAGIALSSSGRTLVMTSHEQAGVSQATKIGTTSNHELRIITNDTERMRIDSSGKVGIGLSSPGGMLHIKTPAGSSGNENTVKGLVLQENSFSSANLLELQNSVGGGITAFDQAGQLGIGTTSPTTLLEIKSDGTAANEARLSVNEAYNSGSSEFGIDFKRTYDSGGANQDAGYIRMLRDGGNSNAGLAFATGDRGSVSERMRIDSSGNVGIGTTSPSNMLHLHGASPTIRFSDTDANGSAFSIVEDNAGLLKLRNDAGNSGTGSGIAFAVDASEAMRIDSAGNVGIGTQGPSHNLDILSTTSGTTVSARVGSTATSGANNANLIINNGGTGNATLRFDYESSTNRASIGVPQSAQDLFFTTAGSERMRIDSSGRVGIGTSSPTTSLHIQGANTTGKGQLVVSSASAGQEARMTFIDGSDDIAEISTDGDNLYFLNERSSGAFQFYTGGSERARLNHDGQLIIGGTAQGGSNTKLRVNGDIDHLYNSSSPSAVRKRAISTAFTNLSTTAVAMSQGLVNNACVVDVFIENKDSDQGVFRFTSGRENGSAHRYSLVDGSNANCSVSLSTNVFTISGLGDGRTYTLTMSASSIQTAPTLKASSTATGTTRLAMYSVGAF